MSPADGQAHQGQLFLNMLRRGAQPFGCAPRLFFPAVRRPAARQPAPQKKRRRPQNGSGGADGLCPALRRPRESPRGRGGRLS